jgi:DNA-binding NarL/FixJ family response regulator
MPPNVAGAIELTKTERAQLEARARRRTSAQALAQRSRVVPLAAEGLKNTEIAERRGISRNMAMTCCPRRIRVAEQDAA